MEPKWLEWSKELQSLAQSGLNYTENIFDIERYKAIRKIAAEIQSYQGSLDCEKLLDIFAEQEGHATPKVDVRGVIFKEGKILLVKEIIDGGWTLPGGWADPNEPPSVAVEREIFEESGYIAKAKKILAVYDRTKQGHYPPHPFHVYKIFILCEITGGKATHSIETDGVDFFAPDNIPNLSHARVLEKQIHRFFEHLHNPDLPTDFD
jgi:ADP-ribose pyrophosphatase YjhB (NUDIX family)